MVNEISHITISHDEGSPQGGVQAPSRPVRSVAETSAPKIGNWVCIHRELLNHAIWTGERFTRGQAWVELILRASYRDCPEFQGNRFVHVRRGQVFTKQLTLATRWKWNPKTVRKFLDVLREAAMVDIHTSKDTDTGYTLITICNYEKYQHRQKAMADNDTDRLLDIEAVIDRTSNGHPVPTIKQGNNGNNVRSRADVELASASGVADGKRGLRKCHPETRAVLDDFRRCYQAKCGVSYLPSMGRDQKLLSELLTTAGAEEVRSRMRAFFENGTKRTRDLGDYSVPAFRGAWNELGVLKARGDL